MLFQVGFWFLVLGPYITQAQQLDEFEEETSLQLPTIDSSSSCGGQLHAGEGTISYKNFSPYDSNERCVWIIRAPNATSYNVQLDSLGSANLVISSFGVNATPKHSVPSAPANISMPNSNVLIIVFHTPAANNTNRYQGFSLRYATSTTELNPKASDTSEDIIAFANAGHIKYPSLQTNYGNFDLSIIIIIPTLGSENQLKTTKLIYIRNGLEGQSCQDRVTVYEFDKDGNSRWRNAGRMCGGVDSELISGRDILMLLFESDHSTTSTGFHLYSQST